MKKIIMTLLIITLIAMGIFFYYLKKNTTVDMSTSDINVQEIQRKIQKKNIPDEHGDEQEINRSENTKLVSQLDDTDVVKFSDSFDDQFVLEESGNMNSSDNKNWWVNSGAFLFVNKGSGKTIFGELEQKTEWQKKYKDYNADETDDGYHPQNIFRLITKSRWRNLTQECYYKIDRYILSDAKERGVSNGLLLFNRYQDGNNLYYAGVRVDGLAIIKKKTKGEYFTMAEKKIYDGQYDQDHNPNLIPTRVWIGVKSEVMDNPDGTVTIRLSIDKDRSGNWELALTAEDDGKSFGGSIIKDEGYAGIRTDFMDVEFDDYTIAEMKL